MAGFITEWQTTGSNETITLPLLNSGSFNCTVSWDDGSPDSTITSWTDTDKVHTYVTAGTYDVEIKGTCDGWAFWGAGDRLKIKKIINWGDSGDFDGFSYLTAGFDGCTNLTDLGTGKIQAKSGLVSLWALFYGCKFALIPNGLFDNCINVADFTECFYQTSITSIPTDLFKYNTAARIFQLCFQQTPITSIPTDLFRYNILATNFSSCFQQTLITSIPTDLFRYNTAAISFSNCFAITRITSIPIDIFRYNTAALIFSYCFCQTPITSIPTDLFKYNTLATSFNVCFTLSTITSIPADLFRYNTAATTFSECFRECSYLLSTTTELFKYNTLATNFYYCFFECLKLQQNKNIFFADGQENTRFLNQSVNFTYCFYRTSFSGTQGEAPHLWECNYGTGTPTKTNCWSGGGNSETSLTNYEDIPVEWGGTGVDFVPITVMI
jgi:hypothetical protein